MNTVNPRGLLLPGVSQYEVDFVIPRIGVDVPVGIDPFLLFKSRNIEVKCQCGHGAFEMRGDDTPGAVGATPAGEVIPLDPDQAFVHTSLPFACVWDSSSGAAGGTTSIERARKVNSCPSPQAISHRVCERPSN